MLSFIKWFMNLRIIRYGMVGGIGIFIQDGAFFCFKLLWGLIIPAGSIWLFPVASACAFEVSNIVNFILNQLFTYREQARDIHGWEWVRRAAKGQLTSLSSLLLSFLVAWGLVAFLHVNEYLANPIGIAVAFFYNFFISRKLVFRAVEQRSAPAGPATGADLESESKTVTGRAFPQIETTPK